MGSLSEAGDISPQAPAPWGASCTQQLALPPTHTMLSQPSHRPWHLLAWLSVKMPPAGGSAPPPSPPSLSVPLFLRPPPPLSASSLPLSSHTPARWCHGTQAPPSCDLIPGAPILARASPPPQCILPPQPRSGLVLAPLRTLKRLLPPFPESKAGNPQRRCPTLPHPVWEAGCFWLGGSATPRGEVALGGQGGPAEQPDHSSRERLKPMHAELQLSGREASEADRLPTRRSGPGCSQRGSFLLAECTALGASPPPGPLLPRWDSGAFFASGPHFTSSPS